MTMEESNTEPPKNLKDQLLCMGFSSSEVQSAASAGCVDVEAAVDFFARKGDGNNRSGCEGPSDERTATSAEPMTTLAGAGGSPSRGINNARDSLDRIDVNRPVPSPDAVTAMPGDDNLQQAIELSRKEQHDRELAQVLKLSKEAAEPAPQPAQEQDPELMAAIAASLQDNPRLAADDRNVSWQSHGYADLQERVRSSFDEPVGLRNIGNTCYLNSLLQVYYHLPDFRRAIMRFRAPTELLEADAECPGPLVVQTSPPMQPEKVTGNIVSESVERKSEWAVDPSHMEQSYGAPANVEQLPSPREGTSGTSGNHTKRNDESRAVKHAVQLVVELQKLFAAMALGNQNCADPSGVAHAMRDADGKPIVIGAQQDASEFNHLLLDAVERGLRSESANSELRAKEPNVSPVSQELASPVAAMEEDEVSQSQNAVKDMFTIKFRQEVRPCQQGFGPVDAQGPPMISNGETNSIIVDATTKSERDLHSGLEDYALTRIEYVMPQDASDRVATEGSDVGATEAGAVMSTPCSKLSGVAGTSSPKSSHAVKSVWFTRMPPVVVVYLQRVVYNREVGRAEKIHDRFDFTSEISFDRYLAENKDAAAAAKQRVLRIRSEKRKVAEKLRCFEMFPSTAASHGVEQRSGVLDNDCEMSAPETTATDSDDIREEKRFSGIYDAFGEYREPLVSASKRVRRRLCESLDPSSPLFAVERINKEHLQISIDVLSAVMANDEAKCEELRAQMDLLQKQEDSVYCDLNSTRYLLHSVLVHDGDPSGGHYWTFIRNTRSTTDDTRWMRLSDSVVTYVTEEQMLGWSRGGRKTASAYCLIYVIQSALQELDSSVRSVAEECKLLMPEVRREEVERASATFSKELHEQKERKE